MPAAIQTTVLDILKSAQNAADGTLNVNASVSVSTVKVEDSAGNALTSTGGALDVNLKTPSTVPVSATALPLPTGASTSAKQPALGTAGTASADVISVQGVASMTPLKVDGSAVTQPVSGTVTVQQSTASNLKVDLSGTAANTTALKVDGSAVTQPVSGTVTVQQGTASSLKVDLSGTGANTTAIKVDNSAVTQPVSGTVTANQGGTWTVQPGNTANTTAWLVKEVTSSTSTLTNVSASATSVSLLASNSSRLGGMFFNDSTAILYLKFGATASTTSYTLQIPPNGYYEIPGPRIYTGAIDGIWSSANGALRITELS